MSEAGTEISQPLSSRVAKLEAQNLELKNVIQKQSESLQQLGQILKGQVSNVGGLKETINRFEDVFNNLDRILEDTQVKHVSLAREVVKANLGVTFESLDEAMVDVRTEVLKAQIDNLVASDVLEPSETIDRGSTVVFQETKDDGTVTIRRAQYMYQVLEQSFGAEMATKFLDKQVGETFKLEEASDRNLTIVEIYRPKTV